MKMIFMLIMKLAKLKGRPKNIWKERYLLKGRRSLRFMAIIVVIWISISRGGGM